MNEKNSSQIKSSKHDKIFALVKEKTGKIAIVVGMYKVSKRTFDTFEEADKYIARKPWELIFNLAAMIYDFKTNEHNENKETNEKPSEDRDGTK